MSAQSPVVTSTETTPPRRISVILQCDPVTDERRFVNCGLLASKLSFPDCAKVPSILRRSVIFLCRRKGLRLLHSTQSSALTETPTMPKSNRLNDFM